MKSVWLLLLPILLVACPGRNDAGDARSDGSVDAVALDGVMDVLPSCDAAGRASCGGRCVDTTTDPANCGACDAVCAGGMGCVASHCTVICPTGQTLCNGACVSPATDRMNCGACGVACASGQVCTGGMCATSCATGSNPCGSGATAYCANFQTDNHDCGACGVACAAGQVCSLGMCSASCGSALMNCSGSCVATATDPMHCGSCTNGCALAHTSAQACAAGACVVGTCGTGFGDCDGMASNGCETNVVGSDVNNCGGCGIRCAFANAGATCAAGVCGIGTCHAGFANCDGNATNGCEISVDSDNSNCGGCSTTGMPHACPAGQVCATGTCGTTCGAGTTNCASDCVHTSTDVNNCGACGMVCGLANLSVQACAMSHCVVGACTTGFGDCDLTASNGCETNVRGSDVNNCGGCGVRCSFANASATCGAGVCAMGSCNAGFADCDGNPANGCETNTDTDNTRCGACATACSAGQVCSTGACSASCGTGLRACGGSCVATATDPTNCGGCGSVCLLANVTTQACIAGACAVGSCSAGFSDCDGMASNGCETAVRGIDVNNCGGCGLRCSFANAGASCASGSCTMAACNAGFADCDGNPSNGCETNTNTSNGHCGICATSCPAGQLCSSGTCGATCGTGLTACGGTCAATATDPSNCGACGTVCALANVTTQACFLSACAVGACSAGFSNCDGVASNGCETGVRGSDVNNCGGCGLRCSFANASATCGSGTCAIGACNAGFEDCDANPANGCETNTNTDNDNCGACAGACPAGQVCSTGACGATCGTGLTACGGMCVATATDPNNCGGCGTVCALANVTTRACVAGACAIGACTAGFADCDGSANNGCETAVRGGDIHNCGGCGVVCAYANAGATCMTGTCAMAACNSGFANCDGTAVNGCETNTNTDNANCGACATTAAPTACAAGRVCSTGTCGATCGTGLTNCSGSCAATATDPNNCGACGTVCALPNVGAQVCVGSHCIVSTCGSGFANCDGNAANGCETAVRAADVNNCGGCGLRCSFANAGATCSTGACAIGACNTGFADCDGNAVNGCEVDTRSNNGHCGTCGTSCASGTACLGGTCTFSCPSGQVACVTACVTVGSACVAGVGKCARIGTTSCGPAGPLCSATPGC